MYSWYDEEHNANVLYIALPSGIDGFISPNSDGTVTIVISTDISEERQRRAFQHELEHLLNDDLYNASAEEAEARCHRGIQKTS